MKILVVEDEALLAKVIAKGLRKSGYAVDCAADGEAALDMYGQNDYDLILLDLNLPKIDGIQVLRRIRQKDKNMRILILSARTAVEDKIEGLDSGCNDYLTKPFDFGELDARIRSLLRRRFIQEDTNLFCGELRMDVSGRQAFAGEQPLPLTKKEYGILEYLLIHKGKVVSAEELIEHVWDSEADLFSNAFKFQIHSLKKKLEGAGLSGQYIINLRGQGYKIADPKEDGL